jgi:hypothetical protein
MHHLNTDKTQFKKKTAKKDSWGELRDSDYRLDLWDMKSK